jgi:hypothetical protein
VFIFHCSLILYKEAAKTEAVPVGYHSSRFSILANAYHSHRSQEGAEPAPAEQPATADDAKAVRTV